MVNFSKIIIPEGKKKHLLNADEIKFIKADRYYVKIFCSNKKILVRITLKGIEELLPPNFLRINKSYIVNALFIESIEEKKSTSVVVMPNEQEFQVSEKYRKSFDNYFGTNNLSKKTLSP
ncbi:LytR/AlgR family response regulator transcription factor [Maribacter aurantiacus]|uniref:LytTR family transcriptional regulator n=1 Tax=Maribacter aurantiacus TaxID=1882343 RepID=A0A5R8M722_9FLAO|nr:LytTR family DNA-binding domain-containing protein [Maribacter aurantiacus]TLF45285.1 LytTR family transcriptional regulator [Maribacter aurantiacus]